MEKNEISLMRISSKALCMLAFALALLFVMFPVSAGDFSSQQLIPLGKTTGIKLFSEGTMIVGFEEIAQGSASPAQKAGLECGDVILSVNGKEVESNGSLTSIMSELEDGRAEVVYERSGEQKSCTVSAVYDKERERWMMGAWVRDSMAGIGTITYVDPETGRFGALGHGICDVDTGGLMPFEEGGLMPSSVIGVKKGIQGTPGELTGAFDTASDQGTVQSNSSGGIFGTLSDESLYSGEEALPLMKKSEIVPGKAQILANVEGESQKAYGIEIVRVYPENDSSMRDMMIQVTDKELLEKTGGIVQGMSGSPIIQNGKLAGAVTHVLINDPCRGYGISIERMLAQDNFQ